MCSSDLAWRLLCVAAMICSLATTITTQLAKSHNVDEHISRAQSARARLEMLEASLSLRGYDHATVVEEYLQCIKDMTFVDESGLAGHSRSGLHFSGSRSGA